jgi:hypothetical protein
VATGVGLAIQLLLGIALCFVPLFDVLGFERAFATGLLAPVLAAAIAVELTRRARAEGGGDPIRIAAESCGRALVLLLPAAFAGALVELVNQPCNPGEGLSFLLLDAGAGSLFGVALGMIAATATGSARRRVPAALITLALLFDLALVARRFYGEPQIFAYSMPFGYWPGSLYDEEVQITSALVAQRALTVLTALAGIAMVSAFAERSSRLRLSLRVQHTGSLIVFGLLVAGAVALARSGEKLGFDLTRASIDRVLTRRAEAGGVELRVDPSITEAQLARLVEDHRLRFQQLSRFFGGSPKRPIVSYVYRDAEQKRRLMGASQTQISRPWAQEIHIHDFSVPHPVLKHELAHAFSAMLAGGPFKVPAQALLLVNLGAVEGLAVAADWPFDVMGIHQWARAMRQLHLAPDPRRTLYPTGFWSISSARAYTVAGSFIRFLIDTRGIERFGALYRSNDFATAYGAPLDALVGEWERFIDALPLDEDQLRIAEHRFRQPGIFEKICAHTAANLALEGYQRLDAGDVEGATERLMKLLSYSPARTDPLLALARSLARRGSLEPARALAERARDTPGATEKSRLQALEVLADLDWRAGRVEPARDTYHQILTRHLSAASDRLALAKLGAMDRPADVQSALQSILLGEISSTRALVHLTRLAAALPDDALVHYLLGFRLEQVEDWTIGADEMQLALRGPLPGPAIEREARLALGRLTLRAGKASQAAAQFAAIARTSSSAADRALAEDWAERAALAGPGPGPSE